MLRKFGLIVLFLGTTGILLSACTGLNLNYSNNAEKILAAAETIANLNLPNLIKPEFTASANEYTLVSFKPDQANSHLYLLQSTNPEDADKLEEGLSQIAPDAYDPKTRLVVIETQSVMVRGQEVILVISDGVNGEGNAYRQAMVPFEGNCGPAMVIYLAPQKNWDPQMVYDLIDSIH